MKVRVDRICKRLGGVVALDDVSFEVDSGSLVALLGPSGSGKSTMLRILAGLEAPDSGTIYFDERDATGVDARKRNIGFVFQSYALFRHLTVARNVAFGLDVRKVPAEIVKRRVAELLERVGMAGLEDRYPAQLSGGQQQRVALARALAPQPRLLLLDEPFGAVDAMARKELGRWLRDLHDEIGLTSIFVTHDQEEAFSLADRVLILQRGAVEQWGTPAEILDEPASRFVAQFVGDVNVLSAEVREGIATAGGLRTAVPGCGINGPAHLVVRSHDLEFWHEEPGVATVERVVHLGDRVRAHAVADGAGRIIAQLPRQSPKLAGIVPGCRIQVAINRARIYPASRPEHRSERP